MGFLVLDGLTHGIAMYLRVFTLLGMGPINFRNITNLVIDGDESRYTIPHHYTNYVATIMDTMPNLTHFRHEYHCTHATHAKCLPDEAVAQMAFGMSTRLDGTGFSPARRSLLKTFEMLGFTMSITALGKLGTYFPDLEVFQMNGIYEMNSPPNDWDDISMPLSLRSFRIRSQIIVFDDDEVSRIFLKLLQTAKGLENLEFPGNVPRFSGDPVRNLRLFDSSNFFREEYPGAVIESPRLENILLREWEIDLDCMFGEDSLWKCPIIEFAALAKCTVAGGRPIEMERPGIDIKPWKWLPQAQYMDMQPFYYKVWGQGEKGKAKLRSLN